MEDRRPRAHALRGRRQPGPGIPRGGRARRSAHTRTSSDHRSRSRCAPSRRATPNVRTIDRELDPRYEILRVVTNLIAIKCALNLLGHEVGGPSRRSWRRPRRSVSGSAAAWSAWSCSSPPASDRTGLDSLRGNGSHRPARRPRRSRQEHDRLRVRRRGDRRGRGARVPARRAPGRRPRPARLQLPERRPGPRDRAHARPRPRRRAAVRAARDPRRPGARDPPHARLLPGRSSTSTA